MRFLLDENVSARVAQRLQLAGHDAVHVSKVGLEQTEDRVILATARRTTGSSSRATTTSSSFCSRPATIGHRSC